MNQLCCDLDSESGCVLTTAHLLCLAAKEVLLSASVNSCSLNKKNPLHPRFDLLLCRRTRDRSWEMLLYVSESFSTLSASSRVELSHADTVFTLFKLQFKQELSKLGADFWNKSGMFDAKTYFFWWDSPHVELPRCSSLYFFEDFNNNPKCCYNFLQKETLDLFCFSVFVILE